ncbi:Vegetative incompatibility protein HET-E-1 [Fusarium oxysporum f. sp. albedinis]|nr:Vegetative incompatibility protein HET-E-1 [Fusarium oxysporum f. sp. albedinis]
MSDLLTRKETNPRSSSHAQLFIIVHTSNIWSFATFIHAKSLWLTTHARQTHIPKINLSFSYPGEDAKYYEITSIPNSWLRDVQVH